MSASRVPTRVRRGRLSGWWWELTYKVGPNLWVIPLGIAAIAMCLFAVTRAIDGSLTGAGLAGHLPEWMVARTGADADVVLSALLAALATALALVFSTSVLTFSLASSQLGPRLIRRFMQDPVTQITLGGLLSGVLLCALTLGSVRVGTGPLAVPQASYALSVVVALGCFVLLVVYVHRVASTIQAPRVIASVVVDLERSLAERAAARERLGAGPAPEACAALVAEAEQGAELGAPTSGFIQGVDVVRLVDLAERHDWRVVLLHRPGQFVVGDLPLVRVVPASAAPAVAKVLTETVEVGDSRTRRQDIEFALYQVVEIGLRALSPAVNDTFTGLTCIDWLVAALVRLGREPDEAGGVAGRDGTVRVVMPVVTFDRQVEASFDLLRQAGQTNPAVIIRLLDGLGTLAGAVEPRHLPVISDHLDLALATGLAGHPVAADEAELRARHTRAVAVVEDRGAASGGASGGGSGGTDR
ncbi:MAG: DUF2254 domain-containing protein [Microthrixaceae bacterium]